MHLVLLMVEKTLMIKTETTKLKIDKKFLLPILVPIS